MVTRRSDEIDVIKLLVNATVAKRQELIDQYNLDRYSRSFECQGEGIKRKWNKNKFLNLMH